MSRPLQTLFALVLIAAVPVLADETRTETVQFDAGTSGTTIEDSLKGYETVQYVLGASAGQLMKIEMTTDSGAAYFNIFEPGKVPGNDQALFIGSIGGMSFESLLPADGDYMIQVYQMRSAARREEVASYTLEVGITDAAFDATGEIPCARYEGQPMAQCGFGVSRGEAGDAELTIFWPEGDARKIVFEGGEPVSSDAEGELEASRESDLLTIRVGAERFEVPDAVVFGG